MNVYPLTVYKGRVFSVELDYLFLPNGREFHVAIVRHPPSVVIVPMLDDGRIVLIKQFRPALKRELWELPAGNMDEGEAAEVAAARECEEEIGKVPAKVERLASLYPTPGYCDEEMIFFRATGLHEPPPDSPHKPDDDEDIQVHPMSVAEAKAMVARGEIIDMKTAYALTLI
jgi:ADP-ribose pyrophosphatase